MPHTVQGLPGAAAEIVPTKQRIHRRISRNDIPKEETAPPSVPRSKMRVGRGFPRLPSDFFNPLFLSTARWATAGSRWRIIALPGSGGRPGKTPEDRRQEPGEREAQGPSPGCKVPGLQKQEKDRPEGIMPVPFHNCRLIRAMSCRPSYYP